MIETWKELSPLQKQMWTSLKRMVRSRGVILRYNNGGNFRMRSPRDEQTGRFVGNSLKDPLEMAYQGHVT